MTEIGVAIVVLVYFLPVVNLARNQMKVRDLSKGHTQKKDSAARIINSGLTIQTQDLSAQIRMKTDQRRGLGRWSSVRMNDLSLEFRTTLKEKKTRCGSIQEL